jgi:hypothetical protein
MHCFAFSSEDPEGGRYKQVPTALEAGTPKTGAIPQLGAYLHEIQIYHPVMNTSSNSFNCCTK